MSKDDDQEAGSINLTLTMDYNLAHQSSLASPLLNDYEVVNHAHVNRSLELEKSPERSSTGSLGLFSYAGTSVGTVHLDTELSTARKLTNVCSEFEEAAIYLKEGIENEKLWHHPTDAKSYWAYKVIHNPAYYISEFVTCVLLMLLAFLEKPTFIDVPIQVAPSLELLFLMYISIDVVLKLLWIRPKYAFKHRRTVFKCILLIVMFIEAVVVLGRGNDHIRVTRALRPLFLLDTILLQDVRRILRQIFQCLGPILDVFILLFFFITLFAVSGFYLFASNSPTNFQFRSFRETFISLYILTTTANFPDVMMESYSRNQLTPIFFIIFLIFGLYIIANVLLAVVYSTFQKIHKEKFRKLFLHRRDAIRHAFSVLAVKGPKHRMLQLQSYLRLMECYSPYTSKLTHMCAFKAMMKKDATTTTPINEQEALGIDEFQQFYDIQGFKWSRVTGYGEKIRWYNNKKISDRMFNILKLLTIIVDSVGFKVTMNLIVLSNALFFFIVTSHVEDPDERFEKSQEALNINFVFLGIYFLEIFLKLFALGPVHYFRSRWNLFDFTVVIITFIVQLFEIDIPFLTFMIPFRFLRLIRFNKRSRAIFNTLAVLLPRIISIIVLLLLIYYFFAIIGMEAFSEEVHPGCCTNNNNDIGRYYEGNGSNVYYLNNFDSLSQSYVTLFELMVVNNWWIIMEGFHAAVGERSARPFFICFQLSTSVVLTVAIAFIVEAFVHKFYLSNEQFGNKGDNSKRHGKHITVFKVDIKEDEIKMIEKNFTRPYRSWELPSAYRKQITPAVSVTFQGIKRRTKEDLHKLLFEPFMKEWIEEDDRFQKSPHYKYNQMPKRSSTAITERLKKITLRSLAYIFE